MRQLLGLLKDGKARSLEMLAAELDTSVEDIRRKLDFLERTGAVRRVSLSAGKCCGCGGCSGGSGKCSGCMPSGGFANMGEIWEVV